MNIGLIIFTRNEEKNSKKIYPKIPFSLVDGTYVIDGNSTDGTKAFWESKHITVFNQQLKGVGGAYESAFRNTKEDALIFFHPDGNMEPKDIKEFVTRLKRGEEMIVATRMIKGARNEEDDMFLKPRKWFCQILGIVVNLLWGRNGNYTTDITQGYRAFTRKTYKKLGISEPDPIAPDFEQIIMALKKNIQITEFPTIEEKRTFGVTSMASFKTGMANIKVLLRLLLV